MRSGRCTLKVSDFCTEGRLSQDEAAPKKKLPSKGLVPKAAKRREWSPLPGKMLYHEWGSEKKGDLIVAMNDATTEQNCVYFIQQEGTSSCFQDIWDVIPMRGLFGTLYTDRGSHYRYTSEVGGKVGKTQLTRFGRAMRRLEIDMIPTSSPEARGRSERVFLMYQDQFPKKLFAHGIVRMNVANRHLAQVYQRNVNAEIIQPSPKERSVFVYWIGGNLDDILCEQYERTVTSDNCVSFEAKTLQIPANRYRFHYMRIKVRGHRYTDGSLSVFHEPRKLADYDAHGIRKEAKRKGPRSPPLLTPLYCESRFRLRFGNSHRAVKSRQIMYYKTEQLYWLTTRDL